MVFKAPRCVSLTQPTSPTWRPHHIEGCPIRQDIKHLEVDPHPDLDPDLNLDVDPDLDPDLDPPGFPTKT